MLLLERSYLPTGTWSRFHVEGEMLWTLEPALTIYSGGKGPVPEGTYQVLPCTYFGGDGIGGLKRDYASYEIVGIPDFTETKFHIGNWVGDTLACPLIGEALGVLKNGATRLMEPALLSSGRGHGRFMDLMAGRAEDEIRIRAFAP